MNEDIRGLEDRLTLLKDFDQVVSHFTKEVSGAAAEAAAAELLKSSSVRDRVAQTAMDISSLTGFVGLGDGETTEECYAWLAQPEVELLSVTDVTGHELALQAAARQAALINGPVQRLAQQMAAELERIDTLAQRLAQQAAEHLKLVNTPAQRLARKMVADQLAVIDNPVQRLAQQVAASMPKLDIAADLH
ncbi:hypothetical protein [Streptomyces sp. NPDC006334]|uniref:hypothetical protein n=1 Tax=Streptomyces sp. NPDC006334 TaxID=3156754 RepID=UPI0033AAB4CA